MSNDFPAIIRVIVEWKMMEKESNEGNKGAVGCRQKAAGRCRAKENGHLW
jgi:hypothetical protein